ncbi:MAG TPA: PAS domain-containing protein, partial [Candidatus Acidoferrum sp.]|nr:PAS domain-containing protein [Candidatus Acidoferrum sp.]
MRNPLRILSIEDDPKDAKLIQDLLETEDIVCEVTRVDTQAGLLASLKQGGIDLILADYTLPSFDGLSALKLAMKACPEVPFIFVSGTLGEEIAIEALKIGATDYVLKTRLSRLVPSVLRALREASERAEHKQAVENLRRSEAYLTEAQRLSQTGSFGCNLSTGEMFWSEETFRIYGYDRSTRPAVERVLQRVHPEDRPLVQEQIDRASRGGEGCHVECRLLLPDDSVKHVRIVAHASKNESGSIEFIGAVMDITATEQAEEKIRQSEMELRQILDFAPQYVAVLGPDRDRLYVNKAMLDYFGFTLEEWRSSDRRKYYHPDDWERLTSETQSKFLSGIPHEYEARFLGKDGKYRWFLFRWSPLRDEQGRVARWYAAATDIEDRKQAEQRLQDENVALREEIDKASMFEEIVGVSPALRAVLSRVSKVAPTDSTVLITGETGTGKELIARAVHKRSQRCYRAFVSVNCAAVPRDLIASE